MPYPEGQAQGLNLTEPCSFLGICHTPLIFVGMD